MSWGNGISFGALGGGFFVFVDGDGGMEVWCSWIAKIVLSGFFSLRVVSSHSLDNSREPFQYAFGAQLAQTG